MIADLVIKDLADAEAELREHVVALEADVGAYRMLIHAALDALHNLTQQLERERDSHRRLIDEYRAHRERVMRADAEAA